MPAVTQNLFNSSPWSSGPSRLSVVPSAEATDTKPLFHALVRATSNSGNFGP